VKAFKSSFYRLYWKTFQLNKINDSTFQNKIDLGQQIKNYRHHSGSRNSDTIKTTKKTIEIYSEIETFLDHTTPSREDTGYAFAK
jgi:hypothetical protein